MQAHWDFILSLLEPLIKTKLLFHQKHLFPSLVVDRVDTDKFSQLHYFSAPMGEENEEHAERQHESCRRDVRRV